MEDLVKKRARWRKWYRKDPKKYNAYSRVKKAKRRTTNRAWVDSVKQQSKCALCGETDIACLDFHHADPTAKVLAISAMLDDYSVANIKKEIEKCIVLCSNCHRRWHKEKNGDTRI
jgi:hypothetical protein